MAEIKTEARYFLVEHRYELVLGTKEEIERKLNTKLVEGPIISTSGNLSVTKLKESIA